MNLQDSTANSCTYCGSNQTSEKVERDENRAFVSIYRHCRGCRRDLLLWYGSEIQYQRRKRSLRGIARRLKR